MLPTDSFSIANSRSLAGSTLTNPSCESVRLTAGGPPPLPPAGLDGAPCALAVGPPRPGPGFHQPAGAKRGLAGNPAQTSATANAAATWGFLLLQSLDI